jgi:tetratricopeptide (TPR) repeat protein
MNLGARYQASVGAYVYVAIITDTPLAWFGSTPKVPTAASSESNGPGDDIRVEFGVSPAVGEIQTKHTMNAAGGFKDFVAGVAARSVGVTPISVALIADRRASDRLFTDIAKDLDRVRDGQLDRIGATVKELIDAGHSTVLENLYIAPADFDEAHSPERTIALDQLRHRLVDRTQAEAAWDLFVADALSLGAEAGRRDANYLVGLLERSGIRLQPPERDAPWITRLEFVRTQLLDEGMHQPALTALTRLNAQMDGEDVAPRTRARGRRLAAVCLLTLSQAAEAKELARRAVEIDDEWADAHATYAHVLLANGETALAIAHADRAVALGPDNFRAWGAKIKVADATGGDAVAAPAHVAATRDFRIWHAGFQRDHNDRRAVLETTASLLAEGTPVPAQIRFFHAEALFARAYDGPDREVDARTSIEELTALIDSLAIDHPLLAPSYQVRSQVKGLLGDEAGQLADEAEAQRANRNDPEIVKAVSNARAMRGDLSGALETLQTAAVEGDPTLLAVRAGLLAAADRKDEARRDLDAALASLGAATDQDNTVYAVGSVAIELGDLDRARELLDRLAAGGRTTSAGELLAGEIAFAEGDAAAGRQHQLEAARLAPDPDRAVFLKVGLAMRLLEGGAPSEAMAIFREVGLEAVPDQALRGYAVAALRSDDLPAALAVVERVAAKGPLPTWALSVRADIGLRTEDPEGVIADLMAMEAQGGGTARVNLTISRELLGLGRNDEAKERVLAAVGGELTPVERVEAADYLRVLGEKAVALEQVFRAFREDRGNPMAQKVLATLVFTGGLDLSPPEAVVPGSHVSLTRAADGQTREHSIFPDLPIEKAVGELSVEEAAAAGLLGLKVGDRIGRVDGSQGEGWVVSEVVRAEVHAARGIAAHFGENFPKEPFFLQVVKTGKSDEPSYLAPMIAMLEDRKERVLQALQLYHQVILPLGYLAGMISSNIPELMRAAASDPVLRPIHAEWLNADGYEAAVRLATEAPAIVITRSGLLSARRFGLIDLLVPRYQVLGPTSLMWQLREELAAAEHQEADGSKTMLATPAGPQVANLEPNDPELKAIADDVRATLAWVEGNVRLVPRPLSPPPQDDPSGERDRELDETRNEVGPASFDAAVLSEQGNGALYADDLGLRRYNFGSGRPSLGFSTITLVEALMAAGAIDAARGDALKVDLILAGYVSVRPSRGLLDDAIRRMPALGRPALGEVFGTLGTPLLPVADAARLAVAVLKGVAQGIEVVSLEVLTEAAILGLAKRMSRPLAARIIKVVATADLQLLPLQAQRVLRVCDRLAIDAPGMQL